MLENLLLHSPFGIIVWISVIDFIGSIIIVGYVVAAVLSLLRRHNIEQARLMIADGALWGLSFKVAGTLLKTIVLHTAQDLAFFAIIFLLRLLLKRAFTFERDRIRRREHLARRTEEG